MILISKKNVPKGQHHAHAHGLLRSCLGILDIDYNEDTHIIKNELGKPSLEEHPEIHYNLTHADGIAACIVCDKECGIDAEKIRPYRANVIKRVFSESEKIMFEAAPEEEKNRLFFRLWTLKESYVKAIGIGISYPMNTVEFSFDGDEIHTNAEGFTFKLYELDGEFLIAVCRKI